MPLDVTALTTTLTEQGGEMMKEALVKYNFSDDFEVMDDVAVPKALPKLSIVGSPRPYRKQDDFSGNDAKFTDRELACKLSKWDFEFDPTVLYGTYLARVKGGKIDPSQMPFESFVIQHIAEKYMEHDLLNTAFNGVYNASGTTAADIADGINTIVDAEITATNITPVATGAVHTSAAVAYAKVNTMVAAATEQMEQGKAVVLGCRKTLQLYAQGYNAANGYKFDPRAVDNYQLDTTNLTLKAVPWIPNTSERLIMTLPGNLYRGTILNQIGVYPTKHLNLLRIRFMMPVGYQIADIAPSVFKVNDRA